MLPRVMTRWGKTAAVLLLLIGTLLVPATSAQAATACAPTAESQWLGTFRGPHHWTYAVSGSTGVWDLTIEVFQETAARDHASGLWRVGLDSERPADHAQEPHYSGPDRHLGDL